MSRNLMQPLKTAAKTRSSIRHSARLSLKLDLPEHDAVSQAILQRSLAMHSPFVPTSLSPWVLTAQFSSSCLCSSHAGGSGSFASSASIYSEQTHPKPSPADLELSFPVSASPTSDSWLTSPIRTGNPSRPQHRTCPNSRRNGMYMSSGSSSSSAGGLMSSSSSSNGTSNSAGIKSGAWVRTDSTTAAVFTVELVPSTKEKRSHKSTPHPTVTVATGAVPESVDGTIQDKGWGRALKRWHSTATIPSPAGRKPAGPRPRSQRQSTSSSSSSSSSLLASTMTRSTSISSTSSSSTSASSSSTPLSASWKPSARRSNKASLRTSRFPPPPSMPLPPVPPLPELSPSIADFSARFNLPVGSARDLGTPGSRRRGMILAVRE